MADPGFVPLGRRRVARHGFLCWEREYLIRPGGRWVARDAVRHPGSVVAVPWDGEQVYLIRQYRPVVGAVLEELPAGKRDADDPSPEQTVRRELREEAGLTPGRLTLLHEVYLSPGFTDERTRIYLAEDLTHDRSLPQGPEEEHAVVVAATPDQIDEGLAAGRYRNAATVIGLYAFLSHLRPWT